MFKSPKEIKSFISWAKKNGAVRVSVNGIEIEFAPNLQAVPLDSKSIENLYSSVSELNLDSSKTFTEEKSEENEDELLYWSSPTFKG